MKALVDPELCIGCGLCVAITPKVFRMNDDDLAEPVSDQLEPIDVDEAMDAEAQCPTEAITVTS